MLEPETFFRVLVPVASLGLLASPRVRAIVGGVFDRPLTRTVIGAESSGDTAEKSDFVANHGIALAQAESAANYESAITSAFAAKVAYEAAETALRAVSTANAVAAATQEQVRVVEAGAVRDLSAAVAALAQQGELRRVEEVGRGVSEAEVTGARVAAAYLKAGDE